MPIRRADATASDETDEVAEQPSTEAGDENSSGGEEGLDEAGDNAGSGDAGDTLLPCDPPNFDRAATIAEPVERSTVRSFDTRRDVWGWIDTAPFLGNYDAGNGRFQTGPIRPIRTAGGRYVACTIAVYFFPGPVTIELTVPEWPDMTAAETAAVNRLVEAVRVHENGHHTIASTFVGRETIVVEADSRQAAIDAAGARAGVRARERTAEMARQQNAYDTRTVHGMEQTRADPSAVNAILELGSEDDHGDEED